MNLVYFFLVVLTLSAILLINVNHQIEERKAEAYNKEQARKFDDIILGRRLDFDEDTKTICKKGSQDLQDYYYGAGDTSSIGIKDTSLGDLDDQEQYIQDMVGFINGNAPEIGAFAKEYYKRILATAVFLVFGVFSIPGWFICCCCCCCRCCCGCCKKAKCKNACFFINLIFSVVAIVACIYGMAKVNTIFTGLANTECSLLQFVNVIKEGEKKTTKPKWAGIAGLKDLLSGIQNQLTTTFLAQDPTLNSKKTTLDTKKNDFLAELCDPDFIYGNMESTASSFFPIIDNSATSVTCYAGPVAYYAAEAGTSCTIPEGEAGLDVSQLLTQCEGGKQVFSACVAKEFTETVKVIENYIQVGYDNLNELAGEKASQLNTKINGFIEPIENLGNTVDDVADKFSGIIVEYSDMIDSYGRTYTQLVFTVFMCLEAVLCALVILFCMCSGKSCSQSCKCFHCLIKFFIHFFWNILALIMIISFFVGSIFLLVGAIGTDICTVISCLLGPGNLGDPHPILFGEMGRKINVCLDPAESGDLALEFGIDLSSAGGGDFGNIDKINEATSELESAKTKLEALKNKKISVNEYKAQLQKVIGGTIPPKFYPANSDTNPTEPLKIGGVDIPQAEYQTYAEGQANAILDYIDLDLSASASGGAKGLNKKYNDIIDLETSTLGDFETKLNGIITLIQDFAGTGGGFTDILSCKFIGTNVKIMLKYLKDCLGTNFTSVGIVLCLAACSMILVISSTILSTAIITEAIKQEAAGIPVGADEIPEVKGGYYGGVPMSSK